jgi:outer membrane protein OmpA-like peptidoglycan-associated protein
MTLGVRKVKLLGVAAVAMLAMTATGCSSLPSVPDWVDPTSWFGDDASNPPDNGQAPDLASLPDKPNAAAPDDKQQVADSLATDRSNAKYSAEALRGGTEPSAAPPADAPLPAKVTTEAPKKVAAPVIAPKPAAVDRSIAHDPVGSTAPGTLPATAPGVAASAQPTVQTATLPAPAAKSGRLRVADGAESAVPPDGAQGVLPPTEPAAPQVQAAAAPVAAPPPVRRQAARPAAVPQQTAIAAPTAAMISPSDADLGFKPSSAPPLDASISQFVAAPIIDRYRSTATTAGISQRPAPNSPRPYVVAKDQSAVKRPRRIVAEGGPEHMTGAVVANLDALQGGGSAPNAYMPPQAGGATAVVYFPSDTVGLSAEGRAQVRTAVAQYKASGGQGYIRVVGHSSSRTGNMSPEKHLEIIFKKSQERANVVASAIIQAGVPADRVLVEAVGDTQPVYYESMPKGEDGNRRAEIFLQG